jgi:hypothetical protein
MSYLSICAKRSASPSGPALVGAWPRDFRASLVGASAEHLVYIQAVAGSRDRRTGPNALQRSACLIVAWLSGGLPTARRFELRLLTLSAFLEPPQSRPHSRR